MSPGWQINHSIKTRCRMVTGLSYEPLWVHEPRGQNLYMEDLKIKLDRKEELANCLSLWDNRPAKGAEDVAFKQSEYIASFRKENYDRIEILIPKGGKAILKQMADKNGFRDDKGKVSVSKMIVEAVENQYGVDLSNTKKSKQD